MQRVIDQVRVYEEEQENDETKTTTNQEKEEKVVFTPKKEKNNNNNTEATTNRFDGARRQGQVGGDSLDHNNHVDDLDFIRRYGLKIPCSYPNQREYKKLPNEEHRRRMKQHIRTCINENCRTLWKGHWGHFIGGPYGAEYFDLTNCPVGKRLNEMIGWKYENPRC